MDLSVLKKSILSKEYDLALLGYLLKEIKTLLCNVYDDINLSVCRRSCNVVAHELVARCALFEDGNQEIWFADLP
jgi:hypothetical protein